MKRKMGMKRVVWKSKEKSDQEKWLSRNDQLNEMINKKREKKEKESNFHQGKDDKKRKVWNTR